MGNPTGYVVRGMVGSAEVYVFRYHSGTPRFQCVPDRANAAQFPDMGTTHFGTITEAVEAYQSMHHLRDVVILAVAEDGTKTALPSYEAALARVAALEQALPEAEAARARLREPHLWEALPMQDAAALDQREVEALAIRMREPPARRSRLLSALAAAATAGHGIKGLRG